MQAHEGLRTRAILWMNRGHALATRAGADPAAAADAYDRAVVLLRALGPERDAAAANSLGAALLNRAQLLHRAHGLRHAGAALAAVEEAIEVLGPAASAGSLWPARNLAGALVNRGNLLLDLASPAAARASAGAALAWVRTRERDQRVDADLALKARRVACDALGRELVGVDPGRQDELAGLAGDVVDDALALVRYWSARGTETFSSLGVRFLRFGAELYRRHQPHFLAEFLEENVGCLATRGGEDAEVARAALDAAIAGTAAAGPFTLHEPASERLLQTWHGLLAARERLGSAPIAA